MRCSACEERLEQVEAEADRLRTERDEARAEAEKWQSKLLDAYDELAAAALEGSEDE